LTVFYRVLESLYGRKLRIRKTGDFSSPDDEEGGVKILINLLQNTHPKKPFYPLQKMKLHSDKNEASFEPK